MSHPELKELTKAEQFFDDGKLDEALEILSDKSQFEELNFQQKGYFQFLKSLILFYQNKSGELIELGEQMFNEGQKLSDNLHSFDGLFFILMGLCQAYKFNEAFKKIEEAEESLSLISNISKIKLLQRKVRIILLKAIINFHIDKMDLAEKCLELIFDSQEKLGNTFEIIWANLLMAQIMLRAKGRFDLALEFTKKALSLAEETNFRHYWIARSHLRFGVIYSCIGEYDISLKHSIIGLTLFKRINNNFKIASSFNNIGYTYGDKGEYDLSLEYLEESLMLLGKIPYKGLYNIEPPIEGLISVSLEKGDFERAQKYFHRLENMFNQRKESQVELVYQYGKALMLKRSSRIRDKAKAEKLLKQVIEKETLLFDIIIKAYIHLCDLLLAEFRINNNSEVLDDLNQYIAKLLAIAEKSHSYLIFCETFILQAKLALINFNVKAARRFLTQAQKIAESYGIKRLAMKISYEHDELLKQSKMWKNLKESEISMTERWKLAGLSEQMEKMVRKRRIEVPELSDEEPVLLLIVSEGGVPFFSQSFIEDKSFESHLFGGFLTTIDYFIKEIFSEGLDRAIFGEYTLLMKSIPPFFISYIFKGNSYYALQKINNFTDIIQKDDYIWKKLLMYFQANQTIQLKDVPLLDSLITETFLTKNPVIT